MLHLCLEKSMITNTMTIRNKTAMAEGPLNRTKYSMKRMLQTCGANCYRAVVVTVTSLFVLGVALNEFFGDLGAFSLQRRMQIEGRVPEVGTISTREGPRREISRVILLAYPR